jgi:hypothetical protein
MTLLRDLLSQGALPKPAWVKHAYGRIRPEDAVLAWAPPTGEPLAAANEWAKRLGGEAIVIAIPETAKRYGESAAGCLTEIVVPEARGGLSQDLLDQGRMAEWRSRFGQDWPSAIVLRRLFRLPEPVPMRMVWDDTVRLQVMQQISGAARRLPDGAVEPLLDLDFIETPLQPPFGERRRLEELGRSNPDLVTDLLRQAPRTVREEARKDPTLKARIHRAAGLARLAKNANEKAYGEMRCKSCLRGSTIAAAAVGAKVKRAWHAHHRDPIRLGVQESTMSDFAILCAFCHELAHCQDPVLPIDIVRTAVSGYEASCSHQTNPRQSNEDAD